MSLPCTRALPLAGILALTACASVSQQQRAYLDAQLQRASSKPSTLVADGCVIRDEIGDDYILRRASIDVGNAVAASSKGYLSSRGVRVARTVVPFACGSADTAVTSLPVAENKSSALVRNAAVPIPLLPSLSGDLDLTNAYRQLLQQTVQSDPVGASGLAGKDLSGPDSARQFSLSDEYARVLRQQLGDQVWVVRAGGRQVSMGKTIGVSVLTAVLTAGLTGGAAVASSTVADGNGYDVALVDLTRREILWKKRLAVQAGDPGDPQMYGPTWAMTMFDPLLPKPPKKS